MNDNIRECINKGISNKETLRYISDYKSKFGVFVDTTKLIWNEYTDVDKIVEEAVKQNAPDSLSVYLTENFLLLPNNYIANK